MANWTEAEIDRLLSRTEARLAAQESSKSTDHRLVKMPKSLSTAAAVEKDAAKHPPPVSHGSSTDISLRIPQGPKRRKKEPPTDAGPAWFNLPKTELTNDLKRDLQLIKMRDVIALGKQFFKKDSKRPLVPDYCVVGTLIEGPTDGHHGRLTRKERKRTIVEEVLAAENLGKFKSKYADIQERKQSGRKGHYKRLVAKRKRNG